MSGLSLLFGGEPPLLLGQHLEAFGLSALFGLFVEHRHQGEAHNRQNGAGRHSRGAVVLYKGEDHAEYPKQAEAGSEIPQKMGKGRPFEGLARGVLIDCVVYTVSCHIQHPLSRSPVEKCLHRSRSHGPGENKNAVQDRPTQRKKQKSSQVHVHTKHKCFMRCGQMAVV